ncbi:cytokine receptor common subunit beta [Cololabis saira]|uniref:cytokine receptor common subunit beta n=1 Tax=Cololabis saira TaxID=129043 RepID=UPI002AD1D7BC|nr:cytokine receptor common subunit beta [Cololabis saira]
MAFFWVLLWSGIYNLVLVSGLNHCDFNENRSWRSASPLVESLKCYNDYKSYVHCKWKSHTEATLQLWVQMDEKRELCAPFAAANKTEPGTVHCRYEPLYFAIGSRHTAFFLNNSTESFCSSAPNTSTDLLQHLRARPPVNLSTTEMSDGGQRLHWSSPYPSSSSLNSNLTYQFSYRMQTQNSWTSVDVTNTSVKLERPSLPPGRWFEARVRARASVGQWSDWSSAVTWKTKDDLKQVPTLHCVLDGERDVTCSWEVSRELALLITYQLLCQYEHGAPFEECCWNPKVISDLSGTGVRYSCSLNTSHPEHLQVDLRLTHNMKTFQVHQHIQPSPPQQVKVRGEDRNWIVEWSPPPTAQELSLWYQVCYHRTHDQGSAVLLNISDVSTKVMIPGRSLTPLEHYQVKVRSLVVPGHGSRYEGIPSEWTDPVAWTSNEASWSISTLIYILISASVVTVFLTLYCTIPACQRRVMLWVDSVPSPGKSKTLSEIKFASCQTHMQSEKTPICKVHNIDNVSTCSSDALLWQCKDSDTKWVDQDDECCSCNKLPLPVDDCDTSAMSFSGPYILCQVSAAESKSPNAQQEEDKETTPDASSSPSHIPSAVFGAGYVCLPSHSVSRSTGDLTFHSISTTSPPWYEGSEEDKTSPGLTLESDSQSSLCQPTTRTKAPDGIPGPFMPWPPGGTVQESGYCHLPHPS